eukprot:9484386-Pyramimonas_sp.AAC.4
MPYVHGEPPGHGTWHTPGGVAAHIAQASAAPPMRLRNISPLNTSLLNIRVPTGSIARASAAPPHASAWPPWCTTAPPR